MDNVTTTEYYGVLGAVRSVQLSSVLAGLAFVFAFRDTKTKQKKKKKKKKGKNKWAVDPRAIGQRIICGDILAR